MKAKPESTLVYRYTRPLLLTALVLPVLPALAPPAIALTAWASGCSLAAPGPCLLGGADLAALYTGSVDALRTAANASTGGLLLLYLVGIVTLAQTTTSGFRGRIVRTFATMLGATVMPFVLGAANANAAAAGCGDAALAAHCQELGAAQAIAFYGNAFFGWLAKIAVPLAVLATGLLALGIGYRRLVARMVQAFAPTSPGA